jgi:hypothetical protein
MSVSEPEFLFDGMPVGYFEEPEPSCMPGLYRYMPYRGAGHYEMQTLRRKGGSPRCYYEADGVRTWFTVKDCPEYGVLELCDFESKPHGDDCP